MSDRIYRLLHGLDRPASEVGTALRIEVCRSFRALQLTDGASIRPGDRIVVLHLNNDRIAGLHADGRPPIAVGLEFRRRFLASLRVLAAQAAPGGRLADVRAIAVTTIFHRGLRRLGFEPEPGGVFWPGFVGAYQRALLASLHPAGPWRVRRLRDPRARRLWMSREMLFSRHGDV